MQLEIRRFLDELAEKSQGKNWGRLFKGDSVEIFLFDPHEALRTALLLKTLCYTHMLKVKLIILIILKIR